MSLPGVSADTRVLAVLGDPVAHSLSPIIQNAAFRAAGVDGVYVALRCDADRLEGLVRGLGAAGGGGNVTLPHKRQAAALLEVSTEAVRRTGACNTFWFAEGCLHGDNTDVEGFRRALRIFLGKGPEAARVLLLGAGGAARAVLASLLDDGVREVRVLNRTASRAHEVAALLGDGRVRVVEAPRDVEGASFDLIVNATRLGLDDSDPLPVDLDRLAEVRAVMDLVYGPQGTPLLRRAAAMGIPASDGGEMLVQQGAVAFERWWGVGAPVAVMRAALQAARRA
jgi:shikimate dehydrogenase